MLKIRNKTLDIEANINELATLDDRPVYVVQQLTRSLASAKYLYSEIAQDVTNTERRLTEFEAQKNLEYGSKDISNPLVSSNNRLTVDAIKSMTIVQPEYLQLTEQIDNLKAERTQVWNFVEAIKGLLDFCTAYVSRPGMYDLPDLASNDELKGKVDKLFERG